MGLYIYNYTNRPSKSQRLMLPCWSAANRSSAYVVAAKLCGLRGSQDRTTRTTTTTIHVLGSHCNTQLIPYASILGDSYIDFATVAPNGRFPAPPSYVSVVFIASLIVAALLLFSGKETIPSLPVEPNIALKNQGQDPEMSGLRSVVYFVNWVGLWTTLFHSIAQYMPFINRHITFCLSMLTNFNPLLKFYKIPV